MTPTSGKRAIERVRRAIRHAAARSSFLEPGKRLVVGLSGGQDSSCLLHALALTLAHVRTAHGIDLVAAHVDHALRPTSAEDAVRVVELARSLGVRTVVRRVDVGRYRRERFPGASLQEAARAARYHTLESLRQDVGAGALVLAHTADDQAETLLLNLLRGTGLTGLAGMSLEDRLDPSRLGPPPVEIGGTASAFTVVRPLLRVERRTTLAYCQETGLAYIEDLSNSSRAYTRNRVRLDLLPRLERFNPAIRAGLARLSDLAAEELTALDWFARDLHDRLAHADGRAAVRYPLSEWRRLPRGVQRRLLRMGIEQLAGGLAGVPAAPVEDALDLLQAGASGRFYHLPRGLEVHVQRGTFRLQRRPPSIERETGG